MMTNEFGTDEKRELLIPYVLGELDSASRSLVQKAVSVDRELRDELDAIERVGARLLSTLPRVVAPPSLKLRILDAVDAASDVRHPGRQ